MTLYDDKLLELAYRNVGTLTLPTDTATIEDQIIAKVAAINDLVNERVARPSTKSAYIALIAQMMSERDDLIEQNDTIIAGNQAARETALSDYNDLIAAEMLKTAVIAEANAFVNAPTIAEQIAELKRNLDDVADIALDLALGGF